MRTYKFKGFFRSQEGHQYELNVNCMSFIEAFFLLTADAIRTGQHYQLYSIQKEDGSIRLVADILKCGSLLS